MPLDALSLLGLFSITIIIGYIGSLIFRRTAISDVIWLLLLGLLLGPGLGLVDRAIFIAVMPLLSALALILILFDAGLNMDFYQMLRGFSRSMVLSVSGFILTTISVGLAAIYLLNFNLLEGLLLGSIVGGTSSAAVIGIVWRMKSVGDNVKTVRPLESIFTDPLSIVVPIAIMGLLATSTTSSLISTSPLSKTDPVTSILSAFSIGAMMGLIGGILWQFITDRLKEKRLEYMLTLAAMFLVYIFVQSFGGSGALAALMFGLVMGNRKTFYSILKIRRRNVAQIETVKTMQYEVSFFMRSFFFVYLGLIATITQQFLLYGIALAAIIITVRLLAVQISAVKMQIKPVERNIIRIMGPRGLAAAVMAQIPLTLGLASGLIISNVTFVIILVTTIYTTVMTFIFGRERKNISSNKPSLKKKNSKHVRKK